MSYPKVTIQIVTWNTLRYLRECLNSIFQQTYRDFQILVIDNGSQDGTLEFLRNNYPDVAVFKNHKNLGFAKANNQGIRLLSSPYVVLCNSDIVLEPDWLENSMALAESEKFKDFGTFGGKLIKMKLTGDLGEIEKTSTIDSCGLKILKNRQVVEIGAGEESSGHDKQAEVFGQSAALVLYRREALLDSSIKINGQDELEFFDEDFFSYKEDVDLAWRMQLFGWRALYDPTILAYHARSSSGSEKVSVLGNIKNKNRQSGLSRFYSYRNNFFVLIKNEFPRNFKKNFGAILKQQILRFGYYLFCDPKNLRALSEVCKLYSKMKKKSQLILNNPKADPNMINKWTQ